MQWMIYMLRCADSTFYIGSTNNLDGRLHAHNHLKTGAKYTRGRRPVTLVYSENCTDLSHARRRESELKKLSHTQKKHFLTTTPGYET
jgi:putative endonuclease